MFGQTVGVATLTISLILNLKDIILSPAKLSFFPICQQIRYMPTNRFGSQ